MTRTEEAKRTSIPFVSNASLIPLQCWTCNGAIAGPSVTVSKPRSPWQNTSGFLVETSVNALSKMSAQEPQVNRSAPRTPKDPHASMHDVHLRRIFSRSPATVSALSSSLNIGFKFSLAWFLFSSNENQLRRFGSCGKLNPCVADVCMLLLLLRSWIFRSCSTEDPPGGELFRCTGAGV